MYTILAEVTITLSGTESLILRSAAVLVAIGVLWKFFLRHIVNAAKNFVDIYPKLGLMADNFDGSDDCVLNRLKSIEEKALTESDLNSTFREEMRGSVGTLAEAYVSHAKTVENLDRRVNDLASNVEALADLKHVMAQAMEVAPVPRRKHL